MIRAAVAAAWLASWASGAVAVESDPLPVPQAGHAATAVRIYNEGVALLLQRRFPQAQQRFEAALALDEKLAEAHNNLAFALRMQGTQHLGRSLAHYDRAIELKPTLAQAYLYRGVLFVQQRDLARARQDLERLRALDPKLAGELEKVIEGTAPADGRGGIAAQYD